MNKEDKENTNHIHLCKHINPHVQIDEKYKDKWCSSKHTKLQETENQY